MFHKRREDSAFEISSETNVDTIKLSEFHGFINKMSSADSKLTVPFVVLELVYKVL